MTCNKGTIDNLSEVCVTNILENQTAALSLELSKWDHYMIYIPNLGGLASCFFFEIFAGLSIKPRT